MPRKTNAAMLVRTRKPTHGNFEDVAKASLGFDAVAQSSPNWNNLSVTRRMTLQEIFHKAARILCGDPDHADHWDDIGGYAELGKKNGSPVATARMPRAKKVRPRAVVKRVAKKAAKRPPQQRSKPKKRSVLTRARTVPRARMARPAAPMSQAAA